MLVIGAGQAGLAAARSLRALDLDCVVHERHTRIGDSWRQRFDSLVLFSSREMSALPDLPHAGDPRGYPTKDEMGDYLERYAERHDLPVTVGDGIARLTRSPAGFLGLTDSGARIEAAAVVVTTGGFERPRVPDYGKNLSTHVRQFDAREYRSPSLVPGGHVIVVGDGATGRQIALELAQDRQVTLSTGRRRYYGPRRILGKDFIWWAARTGTLAADKASMRGRVNRAIEVTPGLHLRLASLRRAGIRIAPRCVDAGADQLVFDDGSHRSCDAVIWALGYRDETSWLAIEGAALRDKFLEERGVSAVPGLYFVGREWQNSRASGLVCGVHRDAGVIAGLIREQLAGGGGVS